MPVLEQQGDREGEGDRRERRRWSADDKRRIVAETLESGASVSLVGRRHDVNANMVFTWRREARRATTGMIGAPAGFVPAMITAEPASELSSPSCEAAGRMEIVLRDGGRVIVAADVDAAALRRVMKVLSRR